MQLSLGLISANAFRRFESVLVILLVVLLCKSKEEYTANSVSQQGDVILQGLFPITFREDDSCKKLYKDGVIWAMAMKYAIDSINNSPLLNNISLGYKIDNTCHHIPTAMHNAIEIIAKYRPNSICYPKKDYCEGQSRAKQRISAVIGPAMSWIAIPIASLLGLYEIPLISYAASSRILSDKTRYSSFLRTVPSDEYQAKAMAEFVYKFGWNYVFIIASDDDYGKMGATTFKNTAKSLNVCIANDEYIPFKSDMLDDYLQNTLNTLKSSERAKVVIVFSYAAQGEILLKAAEKMNITDRTWITSDAWSNSAVDFNLGDKFLEGIITFSIRSKRVDAFVDYINGLEIEEVVGIPWFLEYMEIELDCMYNSSNSSNNNNSNNNRYKRICQPNEKLPSNHTFANEAIANVIDAVNTTANALSAMTTSCSKDKQCSTPSYPIDPLELLTYIKNVSFLGVDDAEVEFNQNGDRTSSSYSIRNLQVKEGRLAYVEVGHWSEIQGETFFEVNSSLIKWNRGFMPQSNCFRLCQPGERIVGQTECCWNCQKCEKGTFSSTEGALSCTTCNETHYTNDERTVCLAREVVYLSLGDPAGVSILTISILGIAITTAIAVIFVRHRSTPIITSSTKFHLVTLFVVLYSSFIFTMSFPLASPSNPSCIAIESVFELIVMLYSSLLLSKTQLVNRLVRSALARISAMRLEWSHVVAIVSLMMLQLVLVTTRQCVAPSHIHFVNEEDHTRLLECRQVFPTLRVVSITFPACVLIISTFISFRERNLTGNFNEAKFISFTTILLCIIFISFISTYRYVTGISRSIVITYSSFVTAFSVMGCLCIPKLYIIFMRPERNVDRTSSSVGSSGSDQPIPSTRTSVSEVPSPDFNSNLKPEPKPNSANLLDVRNAYHETSFVNYGAEIGDEQLHNGHLNHIPDVANHNEGKLANQQKGIKTANGRKRSVGKKENETANQIKEKELTNQGEEKLTNNRKRSRNHVTFELATLQEMAEDSVGTGAEMQHHSNLGCATDDDDDDDNDIVFSDGNIQLQPRAFTVI